MPDRVIGLGELHEIRQRIHVALGIAAAMQQFLPLPHHPHIFVVDDEDLDRQPVLHGRRHFLHVHQHRGFARDVDDERFGMRALHADRGRQAIPHGAEPTGGHPAIGLLEPVELRRPHLVLADLGGDVGVAALGQLVQPLDGVLRLDDRARIRIGERFARAPGLDLGPPGAPTASCRTPPGRRATGSPSRRAHWRNRRQSPDRP